MKVHPLRRQFIVMTGARCLAVIGQAAAMVIVGREASVAEFGILGIATSLGLLAGTVLDFGMSNGLARARVLDDVPMVDALVRASGVVTVVSCLAFFVLFGTGSLLHLLPGWVIWVTLAMLIERNIETVMSVRIADGDPWVPNLNLLLRRAVTVVGTVGLLSVLHLNVMYAYAGAYVVAACVGQWWARALIRVGAGETPSLRTIAGYCFPFFVSNITAHVRYLDTTIVGSLASATSAGLYSAAQRVSSPFLLIPQTLTVLLVPHGAKLDAAGTRRLATRLTLIGVGLTVVAIPSLAYGDWLCSLLFGDRYAAAGAALALTLIGLPAVAVSSMFGSLLQGAGDSRFVAVNGAVFSALTVAAVVAGALTGSPAWVAGAIAMVYMLKCGSLFVRVTHLPARPSRDQEPAVQVA